MENTKPQFPAVSHIDWAALAARFPGKPAFVDRLIRTLVDSDGETPDRLRTAISNGDMETARKIAHSIKGMAGTMMADSLMRQAAEAERAARESLENANSQLLELADTLEDLVHGLKTYLDSKP